jgi:hypothetical protein
MTTNATPTAVRAAFGLWLLAVGAGAFETVVMLAGGAAGDNPTVGVVVRGTIYAVVVLIALRMRAGRRWARLTLALALGIVGTLSLVMEPIGWLMDGNSLSTQLADADLTWWLTAAARTVHIAAVWSAVPLMFVPSANHYFRPLSHRVSTGSPA